ncbi:MAG: hypothetical protein ACLQDM_07120 [Bradyrhizobium sp.]
MAAMAAVCIALSSIPANNTAANRALSTVTIGHSEFKETMENNSAKID